MQLEYKISEFRDDEDVEQQQTEEKEKLLTLIPIRNVRSMV